MVNLEDSSVNQDEWDPYVSCEAYNQSEVGKCVIVCDHASNAVPTRYARLGLNACDLERAIAYDIGAAPVAEMLALRLRSPVFLTTTSRLVIDCNRPVHVRQSIPPFSEDTPIPGNLNLSREEGNRRAEKYFWPYHRTLTRYLDGRQKADKSTWIISVHSFTPIFRGQIRPWHIGFTYGGDPRLAQQLIAHFRTDADLLVGDNEPYPVDADGDYTILEHGDKRNLPSVLIEIRQDLIKQSKDARNWATRLADAIARCEIDDEGIVI